MPCENQIDTVTWWRSMKFRQKSFISLSLATKREIWKSESIEWKTILMQSFWYQKFEDPTIHVTVATCAKFWGLKFQNGFPHAKLRGRDPIFRYCRIIQTCSFTWASQNKFSTTPCKSPVLFRPSAFRLDPDSAVRWLTRTDSAVRGSLHLPLKIQIDFAVVDPCISL